MIAALSGWWIFGWVAGAIVVALVAALVLAIIALANRITQQAADIERALDGTRRHTDPLWDVKVTNHGVDRLERGLRRLREGVTS